MFAPRLAGRLLDEGPELEKHAPVRLLSSGFAFRGNPASEGRLGLHDTHSALSELRHYLSPGQQLSWRRGGVEVGPGRCPAATHPAA